MYNKLLKSVSLPYQTVRGSFETRQTKAAQFTRKIMSHLSGQFDNEGISLSRLGREIKKVMPENLAVFVRKNKDAESYAQLNRFYTKDNFIVKQSLEFVPNENGKLNVSYLPSIAHEVRHLADSVYHPKILSREQLLARKGLDTDKFYNFYDNDVYVPEMDGGKKLNKAILKDIRNKTKKVLKGYSAEDKVNLLQYIRYSLISERNAYKTEFKTAKKLYNKNQPVYEDSLNDQTKDYMFDEKIKLFHDMTAELIKEERERHKAKLKHNHG